MKIKLSTDFWKNKPQQQWRENHKRLMEALLVILLVIGAYAIYNQILFLIIATLLFTTIPTLSIITYYKWKNQNDQ